jgi:hypothetical protein
MDCHNLPAAVAASRWVEEATSAAVRSRHAAVRGGEVVATGRSLGVALCRYNGRRQQMETVLFTRRLLSSRVVKSYCVERSVASRRVEQQADVVGWVV